MALSMLALQSLCFPYDVLVSGHSCSVLQLEWLCLLLDWLSWLLTNPFCSWLFAMNFAMQTEIWEWVVNRLRTLHIKVQTLQRVLVLRKHSLYVPWMAESLRGWWFMHLIWRLCLLFLHFSSCRCGFSHSTRATAEKCTTLNVCRGVAEVYHCLTPVELRPSSLHLCYRPWTLAHEWVRNTRNTTQSPETVSREVKVFCNTRRRNLFLDLSSFCCFWSPLSTCAALPFLCLSECLLCVSAGMDHTCWVAVMTQTSAFGRQWHRSNLGWYGRYDPFSFAWRNFERKDPGGFLRRLKMRPRSSCARESLCLGVSVEQRGLQGTKIWCELLCFLCVFTRKHMNCSHNSGIHGPQKHL